MSFADYASNRAFEKMQEQCIPEQMLLPCSTLPLRKGSCAHLCACKGLDQVINVTDACGILDLGKGLAKQPHFLVADVLHGVQTPQAVSLALWQQLMPLHMGFGASTGPCQAIPGDCQTSWLISSSGRREQGSHVDVFTITARQLQQHFD